MLTHEFTPIMIAPLHLPDAKAPTLHLAHPTKAEQAYLHSLNGAIWRGNLSMEAYLRREAHIGNQDLTREGGITHWILIDRAEVVSVGRGRTILASCESIRKRALVAHAGGVTKEVTSHGIGSVFCDEKMRARGYAGRMMQELGKELRTWQLEKGRHGREQCLFTVLYSDIGKKFYARRGWHPFPSSHIEMLPAPPSLDVDENDLPASRPLFADSLPDLCRIDEDRLWRDFDRHGPPHKIRVALIPDLETMRWHHAREEFVASEVLHRTPEIKGALVVNDVGQRAWCIWTRMWFGKDNVQGESSTMYILRMMFEEGDQDDTRPTTRAKSEPREKMAAALLLAARREAAAWNMTDVQIWNPSSVIEAAARRLARLLPTASQGSEAGIIHREDDSITCLNWYGDAEPALKGISWSEVDWIANEKYAWC